MRLLAAAVLLSALAASGCGAGSAGAPGPGTTTRRVDAAVSVRPGTSRSVYAAYGWSGPIGRFVGACRRRGTPRTAYQPTPQAASAIVAVDGRGASRAATLVPGQRLGGGTRASGLERWLVRMGRESEEVTVDALLEVVRQRGSPECTFWLYGSIVVLRR